MIESLLPISADIQSLSSPRTPGSRLTKSSSILMSTFDDNVIYEFNNREPEIKYVIDFGSGSSSNEYQ